MGRKYTTFSTLGLHSLRMQTIKGSKFISILKHTKKLICFSGVTY